MAPSCLATVSSNCRLADFELEISVPSLTFSASNLCSLLSLDSTFCSLLTSVSTFRNLLASASTFCSLLTSDVVSCTRCLSASVSALRRRSSSAAEFCCFCISSVWSLVFSANSAFASWRSLVRDPILTCSGLISGNLLSTRDAVSSALSRLSFVSLRTAWTLIGTVPLALTDSVRLSSVGCNKENCDRRFEKSDSILAISSAIVEALFSEWVGVR